MNELIDTTEYADVVARIKRDINDARHRAIMTANSQMMSLYWDIGTIINEHKAWGNKFIASLSRDLQSAFPEAKGYSTRNLQYMAKFAAAYSGGSIAQQVVAQLPWGHNVLLIDKLSGNPEQAIWYAQQAIDNGWSRAILSAQIETNLYERQTAHHKITNFPKTLPPEQSDLALQTVKDPYIFDFIAMNRRLDERHLEDELTSNITRMLLELGTGFAFVGRQYHLEVEGQDFYIDMLFYHVRLHAYIVIELKLGAFKPEYAGQINFYIAAVDEQVKSPDDKRTIGILLCQDKRGLIAEYALRNMNNPIGVSEYKLVDKLPAEYAQYIPSAEDLQAHLQAQA